MLNLKITIMKKILLVFIMLFGVFLMSNAQVIDIVGEGVKYESDPVTLTFTETGTIDSVIVEAVGVFINSVPDDVSFNGITTPFKQTENFRAPGITNGEVSSWGYYTATFKSGFESGITLDKKGQGEMIVSFIAYVFRNVGAPGVYNVVNNNHTFFYHNSSLDPYVYQFSIPPYSSPRDVNVIIPFSELNEDTRPVVGSLSAAGTVPLNFEFDSNNQGLLLNLQNFTLHDVPGDVTDINLSIYSPDPGEDGKDGDSFITSAVLLSTTVTHEAGCTYTYGYWKTHSKYGPASKPDDTWNSLSGGPDTEFFDTGMSYMEVLNTKPKGNAYYILAHQYIAAELNMLAGTDFSDAEDAFDAATALFEDAGNTPAYIGSLKGNDAKRKDFVDLAEILDDYNNGIIGPGHCEDEEMLKSAQISPVNGFTEFSVYPNPVMSAATVSFTPKFDGKATIELYNSLGQKASVLFNKQVTKDVTESFTFDRQNLSNGLYFMVLQNGADGERIKLMLK